MELDKHFQKAVEDLNPLRVLNLFKLITPTDCELLGINPVEGRPEMFIWQYLPAPPVCIRPSVAQENASTEDDLTTKLADIVHISSLIKAALQNGQPLGTIMEQWDFMQLQIAMYVNSDIPGLQQPGFGKAIRGFCQRLKGKQGRFRGNLSGKRVDFSGRTVISPDPNLSIEQVALPELIAKKMTYPERVFQHNIEKMREHIRNGPSKWPGANQIHRKGKRISVHCSLAIGTKSRGTCRLVIPLKDMSRTETSCYLIGNLRYTSFLLWRILRRFDRVGRSDSTSVFAVLTMQILMGTK
jgi:DNA-directed RNA polymerase III subunit RPC1